MNTTELMLVCCAVHRNEHNGTDVQEDGVTLRDAEHLMYYRAFVKEFPEGLKVCLTG